MLLHVVAYYMWLLLYVTLLSAVSHVSPPHRACCKALELYCFLGKMPWASVQRLRGVGACRLKYLQWRHAMASFIRCLTSWTIKLSSILNHKVKSWCFMTMLYSLLFPKGIMSLFEIALSHSLIWGSSWGLNWKPLCSFYTRLKCNTNKMPCSKQNMQKNTQSNVLYCMN